jgi:hypothetical protein
MQDSQTRVRKTLRRNVHKVTTQQDDVVDDQSWADENKALKEELFIHRKMDGIISAHVASFNRVSFT